MQHSQNVVRFYLVVKDLLNLLNTDFVKDDSYVRRVHKNII